MDKHNNPLYRSDTLPTNDGSEFRITFFKHASLALEIDGKQIYLDPVTEFARYDQLPKADLILITHHHYDHFEVEAIYQLMGPQTRILCDQTTAEILADQGIACTVVRPNEQVDLQPFLHIDTVAAYNTSPGRTDFHPREREDVGYLLTFHNTRLYLSGDGENTPEMKSLRNIDVAFLSVNQPYTMTVDQAVDAVQAIRPRIFYPYHYGQTEEQTNLERLQRELEGICEVRIRDME